jgi:RNase P protein component
MKQRAESFKKTERLCGVRSISELFAEGRTINIPSVRVIYRIMPATPGLMPVRVLITVPRRHFKKLLTGIS